MGLVFYNSDCVKTFVPLKTSESIEKIDLIKVPDIIFEKEPSMKKVFSKSKKVYKRKNQLSKENQEILNAMKSGAGFKILSKPTQQINLFEEN